MIYCVEDDAAIRELILYTLEASGFEAKGFPGAAEFWAALKERRPELILLDIMLPEEDGITILKKLRQSPVTEEIPVIMASARDSECDKVIGLDLGADDYLAKPFGMMEMIAHVKAVLRRVSGGERSVFRCGDIVLDTGRHRVTADEKEVSLTLKEFELLKGLMKRPGQVMTREELLEKIWGFDYAGETRTVDVHVGTLRTKLGQAGTQIRTVRGVGYTMEEDHAQ